MIFASLFSGFGLADIGAKLAGCELAWGIELDEAIAEISRQLGHRVLCQSVTETDFSKLEKPDILWVSPPCPNFSVAKQGAKETALDIELANAVVNAISILEPKYFILENVEAYKRSKSLRIIEDKLYSLGYWIDRQVFNSADFGVPQTRRRLIVRAVRHGFVPQMPQAQSWLGWYQAIEDLLPDLPETTLAKWQRDRLGAAFEKGQDIDGDLWIGGSNCSESFLQFAIDNRPTIPGIRKRGQPLPTIPADVATNSKARAILVPGGNASSFPIRADHQPAATVGDTHRTGNRPKAVLVCGIGNRGEFLSTRQDEEPALTVTGGHQALRAMLIQSKNPNQEYGNGIREGGEPAQTVITDGKPSHQSKAILIDVGNTIRDCTVREMDEPSFTITAEKMRRPASTPKAILESARIVQMSSRCLARFQTLPDWYELPVKNALACKGIGNGVPCNMSEQIVRSLIGS
jgi:DNA-cytosine methyltransferase